MSTDQRALDLAYGYLGKRDRTVAEVRARLERAGIEEPAAEAAIATLLEQGYLDDARYARLFVEDKRNLEQWGVDRIRRALAEHGVERELIDAELADSSADELDRALALLAARFPIPPADRRERERAFGVMIRKGFDSEVASDALARHAHGD